MPRRLRYAENRFLYFGPVFVVIILAVIFLFAFWMLDRSPPIRALTGQFIGWDSEKPHLGHVEWKGIQSRSCRGKVYRWIVDGVVIQLAPKDIQYSGPIDNPNKDPTTWRTTFTVPEWLEHDASYRIRIEYVCNPLHVYQPIVIAPPDVKFQLPADMQTRSGYSHDPEPNNIEEIPNYPDYRNR